MRKKHTLEEIDDLISRRDITENILNVDTTILEIMKRLNCGISGIVMLVNNKNQLEGVMTDGDIRRALLNGASPDDSCGNWLKKPLVVGYTNESRENLLSKLSSEIRHIPILNQENIPVGLITWKDVFYLSLVSPCLGGNEFAYVSDCISSGWISSQGNYIKKFEKAFSDFIGSENSMAVSSGTGALHLALLSLDIGPSDEVIIPNLTFGATANAVLHTGACPVLVDVDIDTWTITADAIRNAYTSKTKAVIVVHLYGRPCDISPIVELAQSLGIYIIEDCAESLGAKFSGKIMGLSGDISTYSFYANKLITTGEGGMIVAGDPEIAEKIRLLRDHGMSSEKRYWHVMAGLNYRMTNIQAAIGLAQMERIEQFISHRKKLAEIYHTGLKTFSAICLPGPLSWGEIVYWLYPVIINENKLNVTRDTVQRELEERGIESRPFFPSLHTQPAYKNAKQGSSFKVSDWLSNNGLCLPMGNNMTEDDVINVCNAISEIMKINDLFRQKVN